MSVDLTQSSKNTRMQRQRQGAQISNTPLRFGPFPLNKMRRKAWHMRIAEPWTFRTGTEEAKWTNVRGIGMFHRLTGQWTKSRALQTGDDQVSPTLLRSFHEMEVIYNHRLFLFSVRYLCFLCSVLYLSLSLSPPLSSSRTTRITALRVSNMVNCTDIFAVLAGTYTLINTTRYEWLPKISPPPQNHSR